MLNWSLFYLLMFVVMKGIFMCRSIKQLRNTEVPATEEEIRAAALQFVRKVSGYRKPSQMNQEVFDKAVEEVTEATRKLLDDLAVVRAAQN
jgi:hypothetical protein